MEFKLSAELVAHQEAIKQWARKACWPHARQADRDHHIPQNALEILDTCPVPLSRIDDRAQPLPEYPDGDLIRDIAIWEAEIYGDAWLFESMNRGMGYMIPKIIGTAEQSARWYEPIAAPGGGTSGFGMTEPGTGSDTSEIATTARREGDTWVLNGSKMYCSRGAEAEHIVVLASVDRSQKHRGIRAFVVEKGTPGLVITKPNESKLGLRCWITTALSLDNCVIPLTNQLGWTDGAEAEDAPKSLARSLSAFNHTRPLISINACAIARAAYDYTWDILMSRKSGYSPERWRRIERDFAAMDRAIERGRTLAYKAVWLESRGLPNQLESATAKAYTPKNAEEVVRRCMLILGPDGASETYLLEKWYRDIRVFDIFEGTGQIMRRIISRLLMGTHAAN